MNLEHLRKLKSKKCNYFLQYIIATSLLQKFVRQRNYHHYKPTFSDQEETPRMKLIKNFVKFYENNYKEPIINSEPEFRNIAFRDFCGRIIYNQFKTYKKHNTHYLNTQHVYKQSALTIFNAYKSSPISTNEYIFLVKVRKIQKALKGIIFHSNFKLILNSVKTLSDSNQTNPLQLLRLLDYQQFQLLESFQTPFSLKFRLGSPSKNAFPPKIYYKIFLQNQSVTDVAVTAPRNYALESQTGVIDKRLWYIRVTNQPWTPIDGKLDSIWSKSKAVPRPAATKKQIEECKKERKVKWQRQLRQEYLAESMGLEKFDGEKLLEQWGEQLDYYEYADNWLNSCTNVYDKGQFNDEVDEQLDEIKQQIQMVELQEIDRQISGERGVSQESKRLVSSVCRDVSTEFVEEELDVLFEDGELGGFRVTSIE